jgi:hypothetical protein
MCSSLDSIAKRARVSAYIYSYPEYFQEDSVSEAPPSASLKAEKNQASRPVPSSAPRRPLKVSDSAIDRLRVSMQDLSAAARWAEYDSCLAKLVTAANSMRQLCYAEDNNNNSNTSSMRDCLVAPDAPLEAHTARDTVVAALSKLHMHVAGPSELLSQLAMQVFSLISAPYARLPWPQTLILGPS